jgi:hypothetical protein
MGGMIGKGNRSFRRKYGLVPLCPPQTPHDLTRARTLAAARLSYGTDIIHYARLSTSTAILTGFA